MSEKPVDQKERDSIEALAESFVDQLRAGNRPSIDAYAQRRPDLADQIRAFFPLLQTLEGLDGSTRAVPGGEAGGDRAGEEPPLPRQIGEYRVLREIGRGGMGVVYEAYQPHLNRRVALKLVPGNAGAAADHRRLREEAQKLAQAEHPHIVPVYEVGQHEGRPYFSMALVQGSSLADRLDQGPLTGRAAAELMVPVCEAVAEAHRRGIVHRDLKPSNILLDAAGRPLVADFGLAQFYASGTLTESGVVAGTPSYMPPEQASGHQGSPLSDVYSLGAVIYEMLTGRPPFQAASPVETIMMVLEEEPPPPRLLNSRVDRDLEAIALKCLHKQPALRYPSVAALRDDLQAYLDDEPISAAARGLGDAFTFFLKETRFAPTMESWGPALMFQAWYLLVVYALSGVVRFWELPTHWPYYGLWAGSFPFWFVGFRRARDGAAATSLAERQISHIWVSGAVLSVATLVVEGTLRLPALLLAPLLAVVAAAQSYVMANLLSRFFYLPALGYLVTALVMLVMIRIGQLRNLTQMPAVAMILLAVVHWISFFLPGLVYDRRRRQRDRADAAAKP